MSSSRLDALDLTYPIEGDYIDLTANPEQFTGYSGPSAHRVWSSIYDDNCFGKSAPRSKEQTSPLLPGLAFNPVEVEDPFGDCLEKQVYYRIISGM
jgi:ERO1-like protein beta